MKQRKTGEGKKQNKTRKEEEKKRNTQREHSSRNACTTLFIAPSIIKTKSQGDNALPGEKTRENGGKQKKH